MPTLLAPSEITDKWLLGETDPGALQRGRGYFRQGMSFDLRVIRHTQNILRLHALTHGSAGEAYQQDIQINRDAPGGPLSLTGDCTCPVGFNCKHVVSACMTWRDGGMPAEDTPRDLPTDFEMWLEQAATAAEPPPDTRASQVPTYWLHQHSATGVWQVRLRASRRKADGQLSLGQEVSVESLRYAYGLGRPIKRTRLDEDIWDQLTAGPGGGYGPLRLVGRPGSLAMELLLETGRLYLDDGRRGPLTVGPPRDISLAWHAYQDHWHLCLDIKPEPGFAVLTEPAWYVDPRALQAGRLEVPDGMSPRWLAEVRNAPPVASADAEALSRKIALAHPTLPTPVPVSIQEVRERPVSVLAIQLDAEDLTASAMHRLFRYGAVYLEPRTADTVVTGEVGDVLTRVYRDLAAEAMAAEQLRRHGLTALDADDYCWTAAPPEDNRQQALQAWLAFLDAGVASLEAAGWRVEQIGAAAPEVRFADQVAAHVAEDGRWFDLGFDLEVDGQTIPLLPLVMQLLTDYLPNELPEQLWLTLDDGRHVAVRREQLQPVLETVIALHDGPPDRGGTLHMSCLEAPRLLELGGIPVRGGEQTLRLAERLTGFQTLREVAPPKAFQGRLRPYQQQGLNWLQFLRDYGLAGVLADEMGLGKTVQTLAHLAVEQAAGRLTAPSLLVAPTSLLSNWWREAAQFTPTLRVLTLQGPQRRQDFDRIDEHDLVLTTYPLLPRDAEVLEARQWCFLILDEAQNIKNPRAKAAQTARALRAEHRLCLTGTPMENHLGELWAQFDFLLPGFLGAQEAFARAYRTPVEKHGDRERLRDLTRRTAPFILRRTKDVVARELPEKSELLRSTPIVGKQAVLYESIRLSMEKRVREAISRRGFASSQITILDALLKLRQVCCDPRLLPDSVRGRDAPSAKLRMLMEMLPELLEDGRRVLLFSQFTTMLGLIEREVSAQGIRYSKLTGQTRRRDAAIQTFRSGAADLFLISLKAGGVGLNLTEADTVIHYDPWWNPAVEAQATDRAHRIGQDKPVFVYKLITEGTVEEKILALQARKRELTEHVYRREQEGAAGDELPINREMIEALFSIEL